MSKTKTIVRDVVAQGPSKSRRKRKVDGFLFPTECSCSGKRPAKQRLSLSMSIALGFWPYHKEKAVRSTCTVTQAARD